jgi:hypothetical protein
MHHSSMFLPTRVPRDDKLSFFSSVLPDGGGEFCRDRHTCTALASIELEMH